METQITKREKALLRKLAAQAWEAELSRELGSLFEHFRRWTDKGLNAFDLSHEIHEFHDGASRDLYARYTRLDPMTTSGHWPSVRGTNGRRTP